MAEFTGKMIADVGRAGDMSLEVSCEVETKSWAWTTSARGCGWGTEVRPRWGGREAGRGNSIV